MANDNSDPTRKVVSPPAPPLYAELANELGDPSIDPAVRELLGFDIARGPDGEILRLDPVPPHDESANKHPESDPGSPAPSGSTLGALAIETNTANPEERIAQLGATARSLMTSPLISNDRVRVMTPEAHEALRQALELLEAGDDVWAVTPGGRRGRGDLIEDAIGLMYPGAQQTGTTYPGIDYIQNDGTVTTVISVKSIDLSAPRYDRKAGTVGERVYEFIRSLANYNTANVGGFTTQGPVNKELVIAFPSDGITSEQVFRLGILTAAALASASIRVTFIVVPGVEVSDDNGSREEQQ